MDRDEFYKTIDDTVREFAAKEYLWKKELSTGDIIKLLKKGALLVMNLPLSERLTPDEREKIRKEYNFYKNRWNETELTETTMKSFEEIFGKEFFEE